MAKATAAKGTATKRGAKAAAEPASRAKSALTEIGEEAMRRALRKSLKSHRWQLVKVAEELRLSGSANVIRAIRQLGLSDEYAAARLRGDVKSGPRPA